MKRAPWASPWHHGSQAPHLGYTRAAVQPWASPSAGNNNPTDSGLAGRMICMDNLVGERKDKKNINDFSLFFRNKQQNCSGKTDKETSREATGVSDWLPPLKRMKSYQTEKKVKKKVNNLSLFFRVTVISSARTQDTDKGAPLLYRTVGISR